MNDSLKRPNPKLQTNYHKSKQDDKVSPRENEGGVKLEEDIVKVIIDKINILVTLREYPIRELVQHTEKLGEDLSNKGLKSNQMRKFLDALNRIKAELAQDINRTLSEKIKWEVISLDYKFTYAAARQDKAEALSKIMKAALKKIDDTPDFDCLITLFESTVAYHKQAEKNPKNSQNRNRR